jgi:hypothetical protein
MLATETTHKVRDSSLSVPSRDEVILEAARKRAAEDLDGSARAIGKLMEVVKSRGFGPLELEHAKAVTYLDLKLLYDALRQDMNSDQLWDKAVTSIKAWRHVLASSQRK